MQDPIYAKLEGQPRPTLFAASGFVLLAAAGLWAASLAQWALAVSGTGITGMLYYLPFVLLPIAVYMQRHPGLSDALRLQPLSPMPAVIALLLALFSTYLASLLCAAWGAGLDALGMHAPASPALPGTERELALSILTLAALPAVCEELLFRGFVLGAWESRGTWFAVGVSSVLFALLHGNLYGLPAYLLVGAVSGFVTCTTGSVYAGMIYHTGYNAACLILPRLLQGGDSSGEVAVTGALLLSASLEGLTLGALMAMLLASLRLRAHRTGWMPIPRIRRPLAPRERWMLAAAVGVMLLTLALVAILSGEAGA